MEFLPFCVATKLATQLQFQADIMKSTSLLRVFRTVHVLFIMVVKLLFTLEQTMKAQRSYRDSSSLSLTSASKRGVDGQRHAQGAVPPSPPRRILATRCT